MIKAFIVEDEFPAQEELKYLLNKYPEISVTGTFQNPKEALKKIKEEKPDVVFLDIDMPFMNGIELALKIQNLRHDIIVLFITAYTEYSLEAFKAYPLDYILKPVDEERFHRTMEHLKKQYHLIQGKKLREEEVFVRCFGKLEVSRMEILKGTGKKKRDTLKISNRKVKELLAYLISRFGRPVSRKELIDILFNRIEDKKTINHLHVTVYNLRRTLDRFGIHRKYITLKEDYTLEISPGVCDYVDLVNFVSNNSFIDESNYKEAERLLKLYQGTFLEDEDYVWSAETREWVEDMVEKLFLKLAEYYENADKFIQAERSILALLDMNILSEQAHHFLMDLYISRNKMMKYIRHYEEYKRLWQKEMGAEPEDKYREFYQRARKFIEENTGIIGKN
ncbi:MAG: response regulator [Candidatus Syntrophonatronum acetioxidans]|uniref:Stage 0 sporulation protein A homolog n=1 Tax=Candidatus Syntrophonatronum acetioxidans TaxID=1795816 RepID=A0A424YAX0_9FIRM|nr:MAG: response regulator [Candidatus Syntrophonatronum acetioxidans]